MSVFYSYMWLREDGTPYYIGKGKDDRAFAQYNHFVSVPINKKLIIVQEYEFEIDAYAAEVFFIAFYGRKNNGTGILRNLTDGGDGVRDFSGSIAKKISAARRKWQKENGLTCYPKLLEANAKRRGKPSPTKGLCRGATPIEIRKKIGDANRGKQKPPKSLQQRINHRNAMLRVNGTPEARKANSIRQQGKAWITDGVNCKMLFAGKELPVGWKKGRLYKRKEKVCPQAT